MIYRAKERYQLGFPDLPAIAPGEAKWVRVEVDKVAPERPEL